MKEKLHKCVYRTEIRHLTDSMSLNFYCNDPTIFRDVTLIVVSSLCQEIKCNVTLKKHIFGFFWEHCIPKNRYMKQIKVGLSHFLR